MYGSTKILPELENRTDAHRKECLLLRLFRHTTTVAPPFFLLGIVSNPDIIFKRKMSSGISHIHFTETLVQASSPIIPKIPPQFQQSSFRQVRYAMSPRTPKKNRLFTSRTCFFLLFWHTATVALHSGNRMRPGSNWRSRLTAGDTSRHVTSLIATFNIRMGLRSYTTIRPTRTSLRTWRTGRSWSRSSNA